MELFLIIMLLQLLGFLLLFVDFYTIFSFQTVRLTWILLIIIGLFFGFSGVLKYKEEIRMFMLSTLTVISSLCLLFFMYLVTLASM
ncbi:hypothetical protein IMZ08_17640 [Bacillus luteolus]|uniref:NADH dehydrogenase subunit 4L n=1 Tax=Litchfieldia luteola TaxID=682179 RepID=A0ABR9QMZ6_9BACI|nr:hypothetical protein [Cytobacillus luteolus]MBE4909861.1 hypothetical protein [Cytobacillus luteolus]MBP1942589.1 membrane-bound ClpP family serine protease [Cytobacillus luteolus]